MLFRSRRGDSLGGAAEEAEVIDAAQIRFQSQGRFFGGCCLIAACLTTPLTRFNRRGDSLGGAAQSNPSCPAPPAPFQSQGRFFGGCCIAAGGVGALRGSFNRRGDSLGGAAHFGVKKVRCAFVSIAGAILWGVLPSSAASHTPDTARFNRRGDSLGGAAHVGCTAG